MSKSSTFDKLLERGAITPPKWMKNTIQYEVIMGSTAYGVSTDMSDQDIYGWCIPPKRELFPHLRGEIPGFGRNQQNFEVFQQHHVPDPDGKKDGEDEVRTYDFAIYNITKYFQLVMENNPNMIDSLFVPVPCVKHITEIGTMVREKRRLFLHKGCWHKFKGYSYSQLHKANIKTPQPGSKRAGLVEQYGVDVKFLYHVYRLLDEVEQILTTGDINLQRGNEVMKAIRRGEWSYERMAAYFETREKELERAYAESTLPHKPDEAAIKELLLNCLEHHYGSMADAVVVEGREKEILRQIKAMCETAGV
jgi:predicted nucleotidyltransferase